MAGEAGADHSSPAAAILAHVPADMLSTSSSKNDDANSQCTNNDYEYFKGISCNS